MRFPPSFLDEIKARLPVSEVVRRRVKLMKSGREWKGLSPFGAEKTPSFFVNDQKQAWFDFSSGQNGNVFDFLMRTEGLSFPEAVERLAGEAGLSLPTISPETERREKVRQSLHDVLESAAVFFEGELQSVRGARARGYLADRGLPAPAQREFRIGFSCGERFALRDHLAGIGISRELMIEAGLLVHGDDIAVPYDRFRDRVMFPISDRSGRIIAFGGRAMDKDAQAKYLNSPETPVFHKGSVLYNQHNARKSAHDRGTVIAVEGYVDVIAMSMAGFTNVVAPLGTALTPDQCGQLWRMASEPILCFDGDKAGRKAAYRAVDTALELIGPDRSLRFAFLPEGQDPDDLARSGGASAIDEVLSAARPLVDVLWTREVEVQPLDTPERRAELERRLSEHVRRIGDEVLRRHYGQELQSRLRTLFSPMDAPGQGVPWRRGPQGSGRGFARQGGAQRAPEAARGYAGSAPPPSASLLRSALFKRGELTFSPREALLLTVAMNHPAVAAHHVEALASLEYRSRDLDVLAHAILDALSDPEIDAHGMRRILDRAGFGAIRARIEALAGAGTHWYVQPEAADSDVEEVLRQALALHRRAQALNRDLKSAESALSASSTEDNLDRLREIQTELAALDGREAAIEGFGQLSGRAVS